MRSFLVQKKKCPVFRLQKYIEIYWKFLWKKKTFCKFFPKIYLLSIFDIWGIIFRKVEIVMKHLLQDWKFSYSISMQSFSLFSTQEVKMMFQQTASNKSSFILEKVRNNVFCCLFFQSCKNSENLFRLHKILIWKIFINFSHRTQG